MTTLQNIDSLWNDIKTTSLMILENVDTECPRLELMPSYFGHHLTSEMASMEIAYGLGRSVFIEIYKTDTNITYS